MLPRSVLLAAGVLAAAKANSDPGAGLVGWMNKTCDDPTDPPVIQSYHVHVVWDGANDTVNSQALNLYAEFSAAMDDLGLLYTDTPFCPFSHPNGMADYGLICSFDFNNTRDLYEPWTGVGLFGGSNFAYFIPEEHYIVAMNWWRQRHADVNYMFHVNTGCEDHDHSSYAMKNMEYPDFEQTLTGLWCCHQGPPGCSCDITQYAVAGGSTQCLTADTASGALGLATCEGADWADGSWRETQYTSDLQQVELYGADDSTLGNQYLCVGTSDGNCNEGSPAVLVDCGLVDDVASRLRWVSTSGSLATTSSGNLVSDSCPGLALNVDSGEVVFASAGDDAWTRIFLD